MSDELPFLMFSRDAERGRIVYVAGVSAATPSELLAAAPALATPAGLARYCDALNYLAHGGDYRMIHDPAAYAAKYRKRLRAEDPNAPFQEGVVRLSDFGVCDLSQIQPPRRDNGSVVFYVEDGFLGIPYRVTGPSPDRPEGEVQYTPVPMAPLPEGPDPATPPADEPAAVEPVSEPVPERTVAPDPMQGLRDAVTAEDAAAVREGLLSLGLPEARCEPLFAAWEALADKGTPVRQRLGKMQEFIAAIKTLKSPPAIKEELWRLQKALVKYS